MHLHYPKRATEMEKEKREQGRICVAVLALEGGGGGGSNIQAIEQGYLSFQMTHCEGTHTGVQIGPHWQSKLHLTASSNYNNATSNVCVCVCARE